MCSDPDKFDDSPIPYASATSKNALKHVRKEIADRLNRTGAAEYVSFEALCPGDVAALKEELGHKGFYVESEPFSKYFKIKPKQ